VLVLASSPRRDGNSRALAEALIEGALAAGHETELVDLNEAVRGGFVRDCRRCRRPDGTCSIEDGFQELLLDKVLPADALVYAAPLYWYGIPAVMQNFFDRTVCFTSASYPGYQQVVEGLKGKRTALLLSSEESNRAAPLAVITQLQELARYMHHQFVEVINGIGNTRGEVALDPADPLGRARELGRRLFEIHHTDYRIDTDRSNAVWSAAETAAGPYEDV
jgi:multimeric flavodoxin WrbA